MSETDRPAGSARLAVETWESLFRAQVALMRRLNQENQQTFVIVTHDPEVGMKCDRIVHMRDGEIVDEDGKVTTVCQDILARG